MNDRALGAWSLLIVALISLSSLLIPNATAQAPLPALISQFSIKDPNGNDVTEENLVAGGTYTVIFSVTIGATLNDKILLTTDLDPEGDRYWSLENEYEGVDLASWKPGAPAIDFRALKGVASFTLTGSVPGFYTEQFLEENQKTIHTLRPFPLLIVSLDSMKDVLDSREATITDQIIIKYGALAAEKRDLLEKTSTDPKFSELAWKIVAEAEALTSSGYYDDAIRLLEGIPASGLPDPPVASTLFLGSSAGLGVIAAIFLVLFLRTKSSKGLLSRRVDDEAKKLELLLVRATRIDKGLSSDLENVKRELQAMIGKVSSE